MRIIVLKKLDEIVGEGIVWDNGQCAIEWTRPDGVTTIVIYKDISDIGLNHNPNAPIEIQSVFTY